MLLNKIKKSNNFKKIYLFILIFFLIIFIISTILLINRVKIIDTVKNDIILRSYIKDYGIGGVNRNISFKSVLNSFYKNFPYNFHNKEKFEKIYLDIKFNSFQSLKADRNYALKNNIIQSEKISWVPGKLRFRNKTHKVKIRIKGDMIDHIATNKWSFRINFKNTGILDMQKIALQSPKTRDFHFEQLLNNTLNHLGVFTPKSFFTELIINGENMGNMYLEEHPSESYTSNAQRKYGPILRLKEKILQDLSTKSMFYNKDLFWQKDKNLYYAADKFYEFYYQPLNNYSLVDEEIWAKYIAANFLFKCWHGNIGKNLKFYFNTVNKKYEPISFNNSCGQKNVDLKYGFLPSENLFIYRLITIKKFRLVLISELEKWISDKNYQEYLKILNLNEKVLRYKLSNESKFLEKIDFTTDHINLIVKWLKNDSNFVKYSKETFQNEVRESLNSFINPNGYVVFHENLLKIILHNPNSTKYKIDSILFDLKNKKEKKFTFVKNDFIKLDFNRPDTYMINILDLIDFSPKKIQNIKINYISNNIIHQSKPLELKVEPNFTYTEYRDDKDNFTFKINKNDYPNKNISKIFDVDNKNKIVSIKKNKQIYINERIEIPSDYHFLIEEGVRLNFSKSSFLITNNKVDINGNLDNPVIFSGIAGDFWPGMLILANNNNININSLILEKMTGKNINNFDYSGGITIHRANKLNINHMKISNNSSDDAINIVESVGDIYNLNIKDTYSDGLDIDFGKVNINNSTFERIGLISGSDAIDFSGSKSTINNILIKNIKDKGISVGENSIININNINISDSLVGLAVKDSSIVTGSHVSFSDIILANVMTYKKKKNYDFSKADLKDVKFTEDLFTNQKKSYMSINDIIIHGKKVNINKLYKTVMKSNN